MTDTIEAVAEAIRKHQAENRVWKMADLAQAAITTHTTALIEGAGELERDLITHAYDDCGGQDIPTHIARQAAATIAAMKAVIERIPAQLLEARESERAAVVAYLMRAHDVQKTIAIELANAMDADTAFYAADAATRLWALVGAIKAGEHHDRHD